MKFDIIIANPPYGRIGNEITQGIVDNIEWEIYINLMPANDYRRFNKGNKLYQFVDINSIKVVRAGFKNAAVTTMMCKVNKERSAYLSEAEFEIENYTDKSLKKYFYENRKREHYAIDAGKYPCKFEDVKDTVTPQNTFIVHSRDMNHGYIPNKQGPFSVEWNINKKYDINYIHEKYWTMGSGRQSTYAYITFKTEKEKDNFTKFILGDGWDFMCKVLKALNVDGSVAFAKWMPKVSWERKWTVEELLREYEYTEQEIQEVMDDLDRFKERMEE